MISDDPKRTVAGWFQIFLRGMAMGVADLVPGVSGGTVAFITGIYDELLGTIAGLKFSLLGKLFRGEGKFGDRFRRVWQEANLTFLVVLLAGVFTSVALFAGLLHHLLGSHPELLWAFFFGLVAASIPLVGREANWAASEWVLAAVGVALAGFLTSLPPMATSDAPLVLLGCGAIAICAMILPGISGSFILLLLGAYSAVIGAIKSFDVMRVAAFGVGAVLGLLSFSRVLDRLLERRRNETLALLTGFLLGSLNALWPWKEKLELLYTHSDGREEWFKRNAWPSGVDSSQLMWAIGLAVVGAVLVTALGQMGRKQTP
jgi:putative membrane protein